MLKVYAIKKGFKLKRVENKKVSVIYKCAWGNASREDKLSFQIKTLKPKHICPRVVENYEATLDCIATQFLTCLRPI